MVTPIFVLGLERNGTTWIQNILCNHPEIAGAQHYAHWGIKESYICSNILYWGDFKDNDDLIEFLELYSTGDYFKLVEGDKEYFYQNRPEDFTDFFLELMDDHADKNDATYWITKLDSLFYRHEGLLDRFLSEVDERYEEIKFIGIRRRYEEVLTSYLNWQGRENRSRRRPGLREFFALYNTMNYAHGYDSIEQLLSRYDGLMVRFDLLKENRAKMVDEVVRYLDIEHSEEMFEDRYPPNSSYLGREERITLPDWEKELLLRSLLPVLQNDNPINRLFKKIKDRLLDSILPVECPLYWRLIKLERLQRDFMKELDEKERIGLKRVLKEKEDQEEIQD